MDEEVLRRTKAQELRDRKSRREHLWRDERFWRICLKVARSKPYLCAEAVEAEAVSVMVGLSDRPR